MAPMLRTSRYALGQLTRGTKVPGKMLACLSISGHPIGLLSWAVCPHDLLRLESCFECLLTFRFKP
jgi:hypothetical protein